LLKWTYQENDSYKNLSELYKGLTKQYEYYLGHVLTNIGGIYETSKSPAQSGPVYEMVPVTVQKEALKFLNKNIFTTPMWLLDTAVLARVGESPTQTIMAMQEMVLQHLLGTNTVSKLSVSQAMYHDKAYDLIEYFNDVDVMMWNELKTGATIDIYRRNLQRSYIDKLIELSNRSGKDYKDVGPILKVKLAKIESEINKAIPKTKDEMSKYHLKFISERLKGISK